MTAETEGEQARVLASYGSHALVMTQQGESLECSIKGKRLRPVAGDLVRLHRAENGAAVMAAIETRQSELARQSGGHRRQVLAANLDLLVVVIAPEPWPEPGIVDRYLATAEAMGLGAIIVYNKTDQGDAALPDWLPELEALGYPVLRTSAVTGEGVPALAARLARHTASLVGQSGVGKSTLLNQLLGEDVARTADISEKSGEGRHTTTTARLHPFPDQPGGLIDSPGVRDFHLPPTPPARVADLFREIRETRVNCRFNDCRHEAEPGCAVRAAVDNGHISGRRYRSYLRLREQMEDMAMKNPALFQNLSS